MSFIFISFSGHRYPLAEWNCKSEEIDKKVNKSQIHADYFFSLFFWHTVVLILPLLEKEN